MYVINE